MFALESQLSWPWWLEFDTQRILLKMIFKSFILPCLGLVGLASATPSCPLNTANLTNYQVTIYNTAYNEGVQPYQTNANSVVYGSCGGGGVCKWKIRRCGPEYGTFTINGKEGQEAYVLESTKFDQNYLYASSENGDRAVGYYKQDKNKICDFDVGYKWAIFKDEGCEGRYYIYSLGYGEWLSASPKFIWGEGPKSLMEHKGCLNDEFFADGGCGKARAFDFTELTILNSY